MERALVMVVLGWAVLAFEGRSAAAPAPGQEGLDGPLTLEGAVRVFRARGFDLLLADAAVEAARADRVQAAALANPQLSGGLGHSFTYTPACPGCSATAWNAGLAEQGALFDVLSGKRGLRIAVADAALAAARLDRADAQRTLEQEVKRQYVEAVYAGDALAFAAAVEAAFAETLELNRTRYRAGAISEVEVLRVEVAMLEARQEVTRSRQAVDEARAALAFLLGARGRAPAFRLDPHLPPFAVPPALAGADTDALVRRALARRADLASARRRRDRAAASLRAAERRRFPDVILSVEGNGQGTGQQAVTPPTLTFNLALVPPLLYTYRGEIESARAEVRTEEITIARTEAAVLQEVATAATGLRHARERIELSQSALLDRARRARDLVLLQYRKGAASLVEYLDAERTFIAESVTHLRNLADYWIAVFALESALAEDLRR